MIFEGLLGFTVTVFSPPQQHEESEPGKIHPLHLREPGVSVPRPSPSLGVLLPLCPAHVLRPPLLHHNLLLILLLNLLRRLCRRRPQNRWSAPRVHPPPLSAHTFTFSSSAAATAEAPLGGQAPQPDYRCQGPEREGSVWRRRRQGKQINYSSEIDWEGQKSGKAEGAVQAPAVQPATSGAARGRPAAVEIAATWEGLRKLRKQWDIRVSGGGD